jgi:hypothetical protein
VASVTTTLDDVCGDPEKLMHDMLGTVLAEFQNPWVGASTLVAFNGMFSLAIKDQELYATQTQSILHLIAREQEKRYI